jgi:hypothetical protein
VKVRFDLDRVSVTEFGVGRETGNGQTYSMVPVDRAVQAALKDMVSSTLDGMTKGGAAPVKYEPSEKHGGVEYLFLPIKDELATVVRELHEAENIEVDADALRDASDVFAYFARFTDKSRRRLTALRRATQFKGIVRSRNRLVRMLDDTLKIIDDTVFRLDNDFDLLADNNTVFILRPSGFEFAGKLQDAIMAAVPDNIEAIADDLSFVEFDGISEYASSHPRAARYIASIRTEGTKNIDKSLLRKACKNAGVGITVSNGKFVVPDGQELAFLEVLDRRRYEVTLVREKPERYRAASRTRVVGSSE